MNSHTLDNDDATLTMLDVCGSCITDIVYNFLFDKAIAVHEKTSIGLTEAYRQALAEYVNESNNPKFYSVLLNTLHHYVRMSTVFNTISYPDCVSMYAGLFVPKMYVNSLTNDQKLNILTMILGNTTREFIEQIKNNYIGCIIDDHQDPGNIEILQDCILKIILTQRNINYDKFIQSQTPLSPTKPEKCAPVKKNINKHVLVKLTSAFKKSVAKNTAIEKRNKALVKKNKQLANQFNELKQMFLEQIAVQKQQSIIIEGLKQQIAKKPVDDIKDSDDAEETVSSVNEDIHVDDMFNIQYIDN